MKRPPSSARAMPLRSVFNLFCSLLANLLSIFFKSITQSRCGFAVQSTELGSNMHDVVEPLLLSDEDESEAAVNRCASDSSHESLEFELPPIAGVSDVGMETDYSFSSPLFPKVADASTAAENDSKFDQPKELQPSSPKRSDSDSDSDCEFGFSAIQQQLKKIHEKSMEQKPPKCLCLPTILEDCESPKVLADMKPLKLIYKKLDHKDLLQQIRSFHKSYTDKMHKLDVLNQQTLIAQKYSGFIRLKGDAQEDLMHQKRKRTPSTVGGAMRSAFGLNILCAKVSCDEAEEQNSSSEAFMSKLDLVYTAQLCLSWEILNWQYGQAVKIQKLDLQASCLYNEAADDFLQFKVALRRFVEDDANYGRSMMRNYIEKHREFSRILRVPIVKDDCLKGKKLNKGDCFVTISSLVKIINQCRRIFYELLQEKKHGGTGTRVVPWHQSSQALLVQAQAKLYKKKKKVRELMKSKNGIVKMICHTKEQPWLDQEVFDAGVVLKLVARVLVMSEISREQILWCHGKLDDINLVDKRLDIEPTFLLFPC